MPRGALLVIAVSVASVVGILIWLGVGEDDSAFTLGVRPATVVAELEPGDRACQRLIDVAASFDAVQIHLTGRAVVEVRDESASRVMSRGSGVERVALDREVAEGTTIWVCVLPTEALSVLGGPEQAAPTSALTVNDGLTEADMSVSFHRQEARSRLSILPEVVARISRFRPEPVGVWTFWLVLGLIGIGVPALLAAAVGAARPEAEGAGVTPRRRP